MFAAGDGLVCRAADSLIGFAGALLTAVGAPDGLEAILAEGCEVDREVDSVG